MLNIWSPSTSAKLIIVPPRHIAAVGQAEAEVGAALHVHVLESDPLRRELAGLSVWVSGA